MAKLSPEFIQTELSQHLGEGETLLVSGHASYGIKTCFVGLTDQRVLINERTLKYEDKSLEFMRLEDIKQAKVTKGPVLPLDQFVASLFFRRDLQLWTYSGQHIRLAFNRIIGLKENKGIPAAIVAELQRLVPALMPEPKT